MTGDLDGDLAVESREKMVKEEGDGPVLESVCVAPDCGLRFWLGLRAGIWEGDGGSGFEVSLILNDQKYVGIVVRRFD